MANVTDKKFLGSVIMSNLMLSLPLSGSGLFSNGGGPGSTGLLSSNENFLTWLGESVIPVIFQDAVCGDGKCESPEEEMGYGRFGWFVLKFLPPCCNNGSDSTFYCLFATSVAMLPDNEENKSRKCASSARSTVYSIALEFSA